MLIIIVINEKTIHDGKNVYINKGYDESQSMDALNKEIDKDIEGNNDNVSENVAENNGGIIKKNVSNMLSDDDLAPVDQATSKKDVKIIQK